MAASRPASQRSASRKASSAIADDAKHPPVSGVVLTDSPARARSPARPSAVVGAAAPKAASYAAAATAPTAAQTAAHAAAAHATAAAAAPVPDNAQLAGAVNNLMAMFTRLERSLEERTRPPAAPPSEAEAKSLMASLPPPTGVQAHAPSPSSAAAPHAHGSSIIPPPSAAAPPSDLIDAMRGSLAHAPAAVRGSAVAPPGGIKDEHYDGDPYDFEEKLKFAANDHHRGMGAVLSPGGAHAPTERIYRGPRMLVEMQANHRSFNAWHRTYRWNVASIQKQAAPLCRMLDAFVASYGDKVAFTPGFEIGACRLSALQAVDMGEWTWEQATHLEVPDPAVSITSLEHQQDALRRLALVNKAKPPSQAKAASGGGGGGGGGGKRKQGGRGSRGRGGRGGGGDKNSKGGGGASTSDGAAAARQ